MSNFSRIIRLTHITRLAHITRIASITRITRIACTASLVSIGGMLPAAAAITTFFAAGTTCSGPPAAAYVPGGASVSVSLCVTTTTEQLCGSTVKLQPADATDSGHFNIVSIKYGAGFPDPNSAVKFPYAISLPAAPVDLGSTTVSASRPGGANQILATYALAPQAGATGGKYVIALTGDSSLGVGKDGSCANATDAPMAASFTLTRTGAAGGND